MGAFSKQLLAKPINTRYGCGLRFVGVDGSKIIAHDMKGLRYCYDTANNIDEINLISLAQFGNELCSRQARAWFMNNRANKLFHRIV